MLRLVRSFAPLLLIAAPIVWSGCAAKVDSKVAREEAQVQGLTYRMQIDSTRLKRGTGLGAVPAVAELVEDGLSRFFRVQPRSGPQGDTQRVIVAESPAPGWGVRATVEQRPDDFCLVTLEAVTLPKDGTPTPTITAPYSLHFGLHAVRTALGALRQVAWPVMDTQTFDVLRKQATQMAAEGQDPAIDEATFAHAPRPLQRADDPPRYYAPPQDGRDLRR
jgi:hypothetical protein